MISTNQHQKGMTNAPSVPSVVVEVRHMHKHLLSALLSLLPLATRFYLTALNPGPHWPRCIARRKVTLSNATAMQLLPWHRGHHVQMPSS